MHKHAHTGRHAYGYTPKERIYLLSLHPSLILPHIWMQLNPCICRPVKCTLSHLKTIIIAGWQNAAIYTKRTWLLNTFSTPLTLCRLVETPFFYLTNRPFIRLRRFHHEQPSRSRWKREFSVLCPTSGDTKSKKVTIAVVGVPCDRHTSQHSPGRKPRHETEKTGCPLLMSPPLDLPWLLKSSLRVNVDWCMTATEGFHLSLMQHKKEKNCRNVLFVKQTTCINTSPTQRFGVLFMSMLVLRV